MPASKSTYDQPTSAPSHVVKEEQIEYGFIGKLQGLKYEYRADIRDRAGLEKNFREKFEALNRVHLTDTEFARLLDEIVSPDVFTAARTLRGINAFTREDGTPLNYTLVNSKDWCKNILDRMIFDGEQLSDLMALLDLGWKARTQAGLARMAELTPLLNKRAQGRAISGLSAYE